MEGTHCADWHCPPPPGFPQAGGRRGQRRASARSRWTLRVRRRREPPVAALGRRSAHPSPAATLGSWLSTCAPGGARGLRAGRRGHGRARLPGPASVTVALTGRGVEQDADGVPFQWTGPTATLTVSNMAEEPVGGLVLEPPSRSTRRIGTPDRGSYLRRQVCGCRRQGVADLDSGTAAHARRG